MIVSLIASILRPLLRAWVRKAAPKTQGTILLPGLDEKVGVSWDPYAIPHLCAANEHDLFLAQGSPHAQERLWQMDLNRRFLCGRLAEILGEEAVPWKELSIHFRDKSTVGLEYLIRLIGIRRTACASLRLLPAAGLGNVIASVPPVGGQLDGVVGCEFREFRLLRY